MISRAGARALLVGGVAAAVVVGCSTDSDDRAQELTRAEAVSYAVEMLAESPLVDGGHPTYTAELVRLLPNVRYVMPDGDAFAVTDAMVVGEITAVSRGHGYRASADRSQPLPFDSPTAAFSTIWVEVTAETVVPPARSASASPTVRVEWTLRPKADFDALRRGLLAQGTGVFFLTDEGEGSGTAPYGLVRNGATTAVVGPHGRLSTPFAGSDDKEHRLLRDGTTLPELLRAAARPVYEVPVHDPTYIDAR